MPSPATAYSHHAPTIPSVTLLGPGFLSRINLAVGWSTSWRVGLANGGISLVLQVGLGLARGTQAFDPMDRILGFGITTLAGLLVTDWVARRIARVRYDLDIDRFIGLAVLWREALASLAWGSIAGLVVGGGLAVIQVGVSESGRSIAATIWVATLGPVVLILALGGVGWSVHSVLRREDVAQEPKADSAPMCTQGDWQSAQSSQMPIATTTGEQ